MRTFLTLALICLFTSFSAQETITYPYNPDGDVDGAIASPDLLDILGVYGGEFSPSEIQIDGVGLLQVIQELQNQIASIQLINVNYVESTLAAHQQEIETLQAENASLTQQVQDLQNQIDNNALPEGTLIGDILKWNGTAWIPESPPVDDCGVYGGDGSSCAVRPITDDDIYQAVELWLSNEYLADAVYGHISEWDVSSVTDMSFMFYNTNNFNGDISSWDVSSVTNMGFMFSGSSFNGDISSWDVSSVTDMGWMFYNTSYNGDISSWDVSSVTNMDGMFHSSYALSEEIKCLIHTSFSSNAAWPYDWSEYCD